VRKKYPKMWKELVPLIKEAYKHRLIGFRVDKKGMLWRRVRENLGEPYYNPQAKRLELCFDMAMNILI
jgi:hypothetical protein